jgi:urease accessory protein
VIRAQRVLAARDYDGSPEDCVVLDFDHRHRRRMQMTSQSGKSFLLDLKDTAVLQDNDVLELDDGSAILVKAKAERVVDITASDPRRLARLAWHLGNRHLPTHILDGGLRIAYDHVIVDMLQGLGAKVEIVEAPFQPEGGAYGHAHEH